MTRPLPNYCHACGANETLTFIHRDRDSGEFILLFFNGKFNGYYTENRSTTVKSLVATFNSKITVFTKLRFDFDMF